MSGGHWDYSGFRILSDLEEISVDEDVVQEYPALARALANLANVLYAIQHDLDWWLSGDAEIKNPTVWEGRALRAIRDSVKAAGGS